MLLLGSIGLGLDLMSQVKEPLPASNASGTVKASDGKIFFEHIVGIVALGSDSTANGHLVLFIKIEDESFLWLELGGNDGVVSGYEKLCVLNDRLVGANQVVQEVRVKAVLWFVNEEKSVSDLPADGLQSSPQNMLEILALRAAVVPVN